MFPFYGGSNFCGNVNMCKVQKSQQKVISSVSNKNTVMTSSTDDRIRLLFKTVFY